MMNIQHDMWEKRARSSLNSLGLICQRAAKSPTREHINSVLYESMRFCGLIALLYHATDIDAYLESKMSAQDAKFDDAKNHFERAMKQRQKWECDAQK